MTNILTDKSKSAHEKFWWALHNVVAHPLMEMSYWFGIGKVGIAIHDWTIPRRKR